MKNRIIIIMVSVFLIILSLLQLNSKLIRPSIQNKKNEQGLKQLTEEFNNDLTDKQTAVEEEIKEIQNTEYISIDLPQTEEEITTTIIGTYFHHINSKNYDLAYQMLDDKFKNNYFQTLDKFTQYCKEEYTDYKVLEYIKYERRADYILVKIKVISLDNMEQSKEMQINISDTGNYKYTMSFGIEG